MCGENEEKREENTRLTIVSFVLDLGLYISVNLIDGTLDAGNHECFPEEVTRVYAYLSTCLDLYFGLLKEGRFASSSLILPPVRGRCWSRRVSQWTHTASIIVFIFLTTPSGTSSAAVNSSLQCL